MAVLGRKHWYRYDSDDMKSYRIRTLDYLAEAAGMELNDAFPELPRGYEPRYVWVEELEPKDRRPIRKKLVVAERQSKRLQSGTKVEVAGIKMRVRGCFGEVRKGAASNDNKLAVVRVELLK
jgi:hypothetical protein